MICGPATTGVVVGRSQPLLFKGLRAAYHRNKHGN